MLYSNVYVNPFPGLINNPSIKEISKPLARKKSELNIIHYKADYSGCSLYRLAMPEYILNYSGAARIQIFDRMILDERTFDGLDVIHIQRQTTEAQLQHIQWIKSIQPKYGFRMIYEIDDIPFIEEIPLYNASRRAYIPESIQKSIKEIMLLADEITVTCPFMKQLICKKLNTDKVTVIPNFPTRAWMGNMYNQIKINSDYDRNKNKPRILYCGSNAHYDVGNTGAPDDTSHIIDAIINHINDYQWVFLGGYPRQLKAWVEAGKIEYHPWTPLPQYPKKIYDLGVQAIIAPLADNNFNKSKSDLKLFEANCYGLPCFCQDMVTYENAKYKFKTGEELIKLLDNEIKRAGHYKNLGPKIYKEAEKRWLDNPENIGLYLELYKYPFGSPERKLIKKYNP